MPAGLPLESGFVPFTLSLLLPLTHLTLPPPTHLCPQVPVFDWRVLPGCVRRVDLGGKALTNFMKELVSYR